MQESGGAWWLKLVWLVERTAPPRLALPLLLSAAPRLECGTPEGRARETAPCALWVGSLSALGRWCGGVRGCPPVACFGVIRPAPHQSGKRGFRVAAFPRMNEIRRKPARAVPLWHTPEEHRAGPSFRRNFISRGAIGRDKKKKTVASCPRPEANPGLAWRLGAVAARN